MASLVVMYKTPKDAAAFDKHYFETHVPLAKKIPGLRKYEVSQGPVATPTGPSAFRLVATLYFDNLAAVQAAFASAESACPTRPIVDSPLFWAEDTAASTLGLLPLVEMASNTSPGAPCASTPRANT